MTGATRMTTDDPITILPANAATPNDLAAIFRTRGEAARLRRDRPAYAAAGGGADRLLMPPPAERHDRRYNLIRSAR